MTQGYRTSRNPIRASALPSLGIPAVLLHGVMNQRVADEKVLQALTTGVVATR